jgi:thiamine biosynthesis lipoprotein
MHTAEPNAAQLNFEAIGAPWQIETPAALPPTLVNAIHMRIEEYDATWSRFRDGSLVSQVSESAGVWRFPADAADLFEFYRTLYEATAGTVTPLVGRRLEQLGYDRTYSLMPTVPGEQKTANSGIPAWDDVMQWDATSLTLTTSEPIVIDIGAAGKGYLVDIVAGMLGEAGLDDYVVDGSGDIAHRGPTPVRVALEHPTDPTLAIGIFELRDGALCASAPGRRTWGNGLHHILDGLTGEPTSSVAATWAAAPTALVADGMATALFFVSGETLAGETGIPGLQYVRMFPTGRVEHSPDFRGELFT